MMDNVTGLKVPFLGVRKFARLVCDELSNTRAQCERYRQQLHELGALTIIELQQRRSELEHTLERQTVQLERDRAEHVSRLAAAQATHETQLATERAATIQEVKELRVKLDELRKTIVETEDVALLQQAGIYQYRHPLSDAVAYAKALASLEEERKRMTRKDGGAVLATTNWTVNGSKAEGRTMVRDFSKLMLRAFNAEADNLVRGLKPYKVDAAVDRLKKVADTIERLGKTMHIRISPPYLQLCLRELELTADFLQKQAEEREAERQERERLREERKVQQEIERERARLEKERQHYANALQALIAKGDESAADRLRAQLSDVDKAIQDVDYRAANIRAGYVYVISNIGSFGERMVKVGMTRRLDPLERIRELSDASVPFNFDIHAVFFSNDAVGIELAIHERLAAARVNIVNRRREFFRTTPAEVKAHLAELAGELLEFTDVPEALEYRQCVAQTASLQPTGRTPER